MILCEKEREKNMKGNQANVKNPRELPTTFTSRDSFFPRTLLKLPRQQAFRAYNYDTKRYV